MGKGMERDTTTIHAVSGESEAARAPAVGPRPYHVQQALGNRAVGALLRAGADPQGLARSGLAGPAGELPHRQAIERSLGVDLGAVRAHTGAAAAAACAALGARAYAIGSHVAFARPGAGLHLAAHEAAHIVQQSAGLRLAGGAGRRGDHHERQADAVAGDVVAGRGVRLSAGPVRESVAGPVQCYYEATSTDPALTDDYRVSNDGEMAVYCDEGKYGGKTAYATQAKITAASQALAGAGSVLRLEAGAKRLRTTNEAEDQNFDLVQIKPVNQRTPQLVQARQYARVNNDDARTDGATMLLWADCGRSARTVTGADSTAGRGDGRGSLTARYNDAAEQPRSGSAADPTDLQKILILIEHLRATLDMNVVDPKLAAYRAKTAEVNAAWAAKVAAERANNAALAANHTATYDARRAERDVINEELNTLMYAAITDNNRRQIEANAKINRFADPEIGQAYHISTGGPRHAGLAADQGNWNFHWAAVIMKASEDNITLENYATGGPDNANTEWGFQMYGVWKIGGEGDDYARRHKEGQTFHEQHRDVHKQHGQLPTTMAMGHG